MPQADFSATETSVDELVALRTEAMARLRGSQKRVRHQKSGLSSSAMLGRGLDFAEVRAYQPGDDVRNMDWNVTARTGIAHTKLFVEERETPCFLMVDMRNSMWFATRGAYKSMQAARIAALLGWCAVAANDRVGGIVFGDTWHREVKPRSGRNGLMQLIRHMAYAGDYRRADESTAELPDPAEALLQNLQRLQQLARRGGELYVLSDFAGALAQTTQTGTKPLFARLSGQADNTPVSDLLRAIAHRSNLSLLRIHDPLEVELPRPGQYFVQSQGRRSMLDTLTPKRRDQHAARFAEISRLLSKVAGRRYVRPVTTRERPAEVLDTLLKGYVTAQDDAGSNVAAAVQSAGS